MLFRSELCMKLIENILNPLVVVVAGGKVEVAGGKVVAAGGVVIGTVYILN